MALQLNRCTKIQDAVHSTPIKLTLSIQQWQNRFFKQDGKTIRKYKPKFEIKYEGAYTRGLGISRTVKYCQVTFPDWVRKDDIAIDEFAQLIWFLGCQDFESGTIRTRSARDILYLYGEWCEAKENAQDWTSAAELEPWQIALSQLSLSIIAQMRSVFGVEETSEPEDASLSDLD